MPNLREILIETWSMLIGRVDGPLTLRLILQPLVATFFAVRAGMKDAEQGHSPYFWRVWNHATTRRELIREGWKHVRNVFIAAVVLDSVYQFIEYRWVYPGQAVIVAIVLAIIPYIIMRGLSNRVAALRRSEVRR